MDRSGHGLTVVLTCLTLAGCSAATQTPPTSTIQSAYDVRLTWPSPSGYGFPLRQSYPAFTHHYPYMAVDYWRYSALGANFVHERYGWQPQPGIGYINDQGIGRSTWPDDSD